MLSLKRLTSRHGDLVTDIGVSRVVINEDSAAIVTRGGLFLAIRIGKATWGAGEILISGYTPTRQVSHCRVVWTSQSRAWLQLSESKVSGDVV